MNNYQTGFNPYYSPSAMYSPQYQATYQPNQFQGSQVAQNKPQSVFMQQPSPIQGVEFVTQDEAKAYRVYPNNKVLLMDRDNSIFYIKSADAMGQSSLEAYEFKRVDPNAPKQEEPKVDFAEFVTFSELNNFKDEVYRRIDNALRRDNSQPKRNNEGGKNNGKSTR